MQLYTCNNVQAIHMYYMCGTCVLKVFYTCITCFHINIVRCLLLILSIIGEINQFLSSEF